MGRVVKPAKAHSWLKERDLVLNSPRIHSEAVRSHHQVLVVSTDYRDPRKAGFQEYVIASDFNTVRIPRNISKRAGSTVGVAYVAAALSLGICMGVDFSTVLDGPDLSELVRKLDPEQLPQDIRAECLSSISQGEGALPGDWLAIWGGMLPHAPSIYILSLTLDQAHPRQPISQSSSPASQASKSSR